MKRINNEGQSLLRNEETDEELMRQYQAGSEEAFKALYSRHSGKIFGYLKSRLSSEQEAIDLFQEVFIKIHKSKNLYNRFLPVLPWIFSIARSVLIDGRRSSARKKEVFDYNFDQLPAVEDLQSGQLATVMPHIDRLPENQSVALKMRYVNEKTFEEIAKTLKTSPLNVRQIVSRAVKSLKQILNDEDNSNGNR